ncbi:MAG TPA: anti-sigma factor [Stellaceae bacterium]|jgi:anti-sigma factor RsiW|nr:anti-sigma factor [Stellaceae bacterium]
MQKHSDESLIAYLDGELDAGERAHVEAWLDADPAMRDRLLALAESATLLRAAFEEIAKEPVPERLIAAARGETAVAIEAEIVALPTRRRTPAPAPRRRYVGLALAAGIAGLLVGGSLTYYGNGLLVPTARPTDRQVQTASINSWLDNAAGNYKLMVNAGGETLVDVPASGDNGEALQKISQSLPQQVRLPDLKPWGLSFRGARLVVVEGRPAAQLIYTTDNKAIGPLTLIIGSSKQPDISPTFDKRQDLNLLYWRHQGRASVLVGQSEIGYLWGIANDVAWQLDAI